MKSLIARVLRSLRRVFRAIRDASAYLLGFGEGLLYGALGGLSRVEEIEEVQETVVDTVASEVVEQPVARPVPEGTIAQRVKNAILAADAGRSIDKEFDLSKAEHVLARAWFMTLDEGHIRALRHMPMPALGAHLNPRYSVKAHGLPRYPAVANANAPAFTEASDDMDFETAIQARP